jgi:hypothetical protein
MRLYGQTLINSLIIIRALVANYFLPQMRGFTVGAYCIRPIAYALLHTPYCIRPLINIDKCFAINFIYIYLFYREAFIYTLVY